MIRVRPAPSTRHTRCMYVVYVLKVNSISGVLCYRSVCSVSNAVVVCSIKCYCTFALDTLCARKCISTEQPKIYTLFLIQLTESRPHTQMPIALPFMLSFSILANFEVGSWLSHVGTILCRR